MFRDHVGVGWPSSSSGAQRIIMLVYDPTRNALSEGNSLSSRKPPPRMNTLANVDITTAFAEWLGAHRYREDYFRNRTCCWRAQTGVSLKSRPSCRP